jgi:hypothetical protein
MHNRTNPLISARALAVLVSGSAVSVLPTEVQAASLTLPGAPAIIAHPEPLHLEQAAALTLDQSVVEIELYPTVWQVRFRLTLAGRPAPAEPWLLGLPDPGSRLPGGDDGSPLLRRIVGAAPPPEPPPMLVLTSAEHGDIELARRPRIRGATVWPAPELHGRVDGVELEVESRAYALPAPDSSELAEGDAPVGSRRVAPFAVPTEWWTVQVSPQTDGAAEIELTSLQPLARWVRTDAQPGRDPQSTCTETVGTTGAWNRMETIVLLEHDGAFAGATPPTSFRVNPHGPPGTVACVRAPAQRGSDGTLSLSVQPADIERAVLISLWVPATATDGFTPFDADYDLSGLAPAWRVHDYVARFARSSEAAGIGDDASWDDARRKAVYWVPFVEQLRAIVDKDPDGSSMRFAAKILWKLATGCMVSYTEVEGDRVYYDGSGCVRWLTGGVPTDVLPKERGGPEPDILLYSPGYLEVEGELHRGEASAFGGNGPPVELAFDIQKERRLRRWGLLGGALFALLAGLGLWRWRRRRMRTTPP